MFEVSLFTLGGSIVQACGKMGSVAALRPFYLEKNHAFECFRLEQLSIHSIPYNWNPLICPGEATWNLEPASQS